MQALSSLLALSLILSSAPGPDPAATPPTEDVADADDVSPDSTDADATPDADPTPEGEPGVEPDAASDEPAPAEPAVEPADEAKVEPPAPTVETTTVAEPVPAGRDRLGCGGSKSCRRMSAGGIVVGSLGLIGVGVGIGLLLKPDQVVEGQPIFVTSTHPPGLVSVTICSGLTLTAVLMLVAAHKGYKKRDLAGARVQPSGLGLRF